MTTHEPILVATDLSPQSAEAVRQGAALAARRGAVLHLCHVLPDLSQVRVLFPQDVGRDSEALDALHARAREAVRESVAALVATPPTPEHIHIETGSPHVGIRSAAERLGAAVVVVGPGGTGPRVAHGATWSVLVARPAPAGGDVLAATDFSDPALPAIAAAAEAASQMGVPLRLLHAIDLPVGYADGVGVGVPALVAVPEHVFQGLEQDAQTRLRDALGRFNAAGTALVARGAAASSIVAAATASPTALVVVGTHGRSGLRRLLLGSVAESVMRNAPGPVLVVPLHDGD